MAAHRYWRILLKSINGGSNGGIGELQMRTTIGGSNVATGGTPSASSVLSGTWTAAKAFDGLTTDTGTLNGWAASGFSGSDGPFSRPWLKYDFGAGNEKDIQEIVIFAPGSGGMGLSELPTAWDFQFSDDNVSWKTQRSYMFDSSTAAWAFSTSRIYDVRPLGAIDIHNYILFAEAYSHPYVTPGQPSEPVFDPNSEEGQMRPNNRERFSAQIGAGGLYRIAGSTTSLGNPAPRRVRLYHQFEGRIFAEQYTKADGLFEFKNLSIGPWTVVGVDDTGTQNGVIFSHVNAAPM